MSETKRGRGQERVFLHSAVLEYYARCSKKTSVKRSPGSIGNSYAEITIEVTAGNRIFSAGNRSRKFILSLTMSLVGSCANVKTRKINSIKFCNISEMFFWDSPVALLESMNNEICISPGLTDLSIFGYWPTTLFPSHIIPYALLPSDKMSQMYYTIFYVINWLFMDNWISIAPACKIDGERL